MKVFLIGLPGSGKSTIGKQLAELLNVQFVDLDLEIEKTVGSTVRNIFSSKGENHFRKLEQDELLKWTRGAQSFVMATGGGTPCFFNNMNEINQGGLSIFLDVPVDEIVRRMENLNAESRPLLAGNDPNLIREKVRKMREERIQFYSRAKFIVAGTDPSASQLKAFI